MRHKRINVCICDVDEGNCRLLSETIKKCTESRNTEAYELWIDCFYSGKALLDAMETIRYDIAFIDMNLCDMNGLKLGDYIRNVFVNHQMQLIFMSKSYLYAMELFEIRPLHFLVKPIGEQKVIHTFSRALEIIGKEEGFFSYVKNRISCYEEIDHILYFESMNRQLVMHTIGGNIIFYGKIKDVKSRLRNSGFVMVHQSYLVNMKYITKYEGKREIVLNNGEKIQISYNKRSEVFRILGWENV